MKVDQGVAISEGLFLRMDVVPHSLTERISVLEKSACESHVLGLCSFYRTLLSGDRHDLARVNHELALLEKSYLKK